MPIAIGIEADWVSLIAILIPLLLEGSRGTAASHISTEAPCRRGCQCSPEIPHAPSIGALRQSVTEPELNTPTSRS